jgi:uroporphyrinogen decarboxylase
MLASGGYFEPVHFPLANARTPEDIEAIPWPVMTAEEAAFIRAQAAHWRRTTDYAALACFGGNILENGNFLFGFAEFMMRLAADRDLVECFFDRLVRWHIANLEVFLPAVEGLVDIVAVGDDLGTQTSLIVSPATYRQMVKPRQAKVYEHIRRHSSAHLFLHSCGAIEPILGDLIEIGIEIINPVQIGAAGMEPETLKRKYGEHLTFWGGGCDTQHTLPHGTVADVEAEVRRLVETFKPGGGFVFTQVHNILANVPPEKIVALYDTAYAAGGYG